MIHCKLDSISYYSLVINILAPENFCCPNSFFKAGEMLDFIFSTADLMFDSIILKIFNQF